jgi:hypothetical protein
LTDFVPFPKIPRWDGAQHIFITEKIDGTNAQIVISDDCQEIRCGSRSRWITPDDDNFGFAGWVFQNKEQLLKLGKGQHFGEWWGLGIQRSYNLRERRFSLFNTTRWSTEEQQERLAGIDGVSVVPTLYQGPFSEKVIDEVMDKLWKDGSVASPGFQNPEGVVIYMPGTRTLFKKTFEGNISKYLLN